QQQVRETDGVVSEGATMRLAEPRGERNRSEPRFFTFTQVQPCEPAKLPSIGHRSVSSRFNATQAPIAGDGSAKMLTLNASIPQEQLTVSCNGGGRRSFAELYTRDYLYSLPPLFLAACKGNTAITYLLLKYGAPAVVCDPMGNTPLHLAVCQRVVNWESVLD
ncbi:Ankyrin repeat-containing domain, partial [Trinorchestia longiramus]